MLWITIEVKAIIFKQSEMIGKVKTPPIHVVNSHFLTHFTECHWFKHIMQYSPFSNISQISYNIILNIMISYFSDKYCNQ